MDAKEKKEATTTDTSDTGKGADAKGVAEAAAEGAKPDAGAEKVRPDSGKEKAENSAGADDKAGNAEVGNAEGAQRTQTDKAEEDAAAKSRGKEEKSNPVLSALGILICVILAPILVLNIALIVQGFTQDNSVLPNIGGKFPLMVQSGSMSPTIEVGDLIIVTVPEKGAEFGKGDVITFWDGEPGGPLVTHRITEVTKDDDGKKAYRTKGDANSAEDAVLVYDKDIVGTYVTRIPYLGDVAMFMQTIPGLVVCVVLPLFIFVVYDVIRRRQLSKSEQEETAALLAELEKLKAEQKK